MQFHHFQIPGLNRAVHGECRAPDQTDGLPAVLMIADILLSRGHGFYPYLAESLAASRLVYSYDASSSGYAPGRQGIGGGLAADYRLGSELEDLSLLVAALCESRLGCARRWDGRSLCLVGHGKGAALALHLERRLRERPGRLDVTLVLLSPPSTLVREGWNASRAGPVRVPGDEEPAIELGPGFLGDARELEQQESLLELMATTDAAVLLIAGEEDRLFPVREAELLAQAAARPEVRLVVVEKAGHKFGVSHPFGGPTPALVYVCDVVDRFLERVTA
ncbi:MAG: alpha/beta hydrolase [Planctomycetota bacterium]